MTAAIASDPYISGISSGSSFMTDVKERLCSQGNTGKKKKTVTSLFWIINNSDYPESDLYATMKSHWWKILDSSGVKKKKLMSSSVSRDE